MKLTVEADVIVLERIMAPKQSDGGIMLPDIAQTQMNADKTAKVVDMGKDVKSIAKVGDTVVFSPAYVNAVVLEKRQLIFCTAKNILAVVH
jgi:co-chaperonin GroES (HSP10)